MTDEPENPIKAHIATHGPAPTKKPKAAARRAFNLRKIWLARAMEQLEIAIGRVKEQPGTIYKEAELDLLTEAVATFRRTTGLVVPPPPALTQDDLDHFMDWLQNAPANEPMSKEELAALHASLDTTPVDEDDGAEEPEGPDRN